MIRLFQETGREKSGHCNDHIAQTGTMTGDLGMGSRNERVNKVESAECMYACDIPCSIVQGLYIMGGSGPGKGAVCSRCMQDVRGHVK